ncbi:MAG: DUF4266 domain-containing protein [Gammaproteobacteria bacterium]|nr:DUF4266 domain-containing protein [Gammaproteobacteria bacterium]MDO9317441.1 DUF4266 domain-containing protein [Gammaproteobacteria bacterium]
MQPTRLNKPGLPLLQKAIVLAVLAASTSACSLIQPVQPWEKGTLAKPEMIFDEDRLDSAYVEHTYSSKEAAFGGAGVGGGGCGCN